MSVISEKVKSQIKCMAELKINYFFLAFPDSSRYVVIFIQYAFSCDGNYFFLAFPDFSRYVVTFSEYAFGYGGSISFRRSLIFPVA